MRSFISWILYSRSARCIRILLGRGYDFVRQCAHQAYIETSRSKYAIHPSVTWGYDTQVYGEGSISIGEGTYLGRGCFVLSHPAGVRLEIGKHCAISHNVHARTEKHARVYHLRDEKSAAPLGADIHIGDYVWIGANVFIRGGVTIGDNSIIGANSVVTRDIPPNTIYGGVPARLIRDMAIYLESTDSAKRPAHG
jgi:maltose O-acetyltransferase